GEYVKNRTRRGARCSKKDKMGRPWDKTRIWIVEAGKGPLNPNHNPRQCEDRREAKQPATAEPGYLAAGASPAEPYPQKEQRLPGERIERPHSVRPRIDRQRDPFVELDRQPEDEGGEKYHPRPGPEPRHYEGKNRQQDNVERQKGHKSG